MESHQILGVLLAGGKSSRMGQSKAELKYNATTTMLDFGKQTLRQAGVSQVLVSGNQYDIADIQPELGPVFAIYSVINQLPAKLPKALLILPIDMPFMTKSALQQLRQTGEISNQACCYQQHQLPLYLPLNLPNITAINQLCLPLTLNKQANKGPSFKALFQQIPIKEIRCQNPKCLVNTNTPEEWQRAKSEFQYQSKRSIYG